MADLPIHHTIARTYIKSRATLAVALNVSNVFNRFWHVGPYHKLKLYGISGLISDIMPLQEYPDNAGVL